MKNLCKYSELFGKVKEGVHSYRIYDIAIVDGKPKLLSTFDYIYTALGIINNEEDEFRFDS